MVTVCQLENPKLKLTAFLPLHPTVLYLKLLSEEFKELKDLLLRARARAGLTVADSEAQGVSVNVKRKRTGREPGLIVMTTILLPLFSQPPNSTFLKSSISNSFSNWVWSHLSP